MDEGSGQLLTVLMSPELLHALDQRDLLCRRIRIDPGTPDDDGFYTPVVTVDASDNPLEVAEKRARVAEASELFLATYCARGQWTPALRDLTDPASWIEAAREAVERGE